MRAGFQARALATALAAAMGAAMAVAVPGCAPAPDPSGEPSRVLAATIPPLADLLARVAGPGWEVRTILPPGASPHVFEPGPRDVRALFPARVVVFVGAGYDEWIRRAVAACASEAALHDAGASVGVVAEEGHDDEPGHEEGHEHGTLGHDPHWWLSPRLAARAVPALAERLASLDPPGRAGYEARGHTLAGELARLDSELSAALAPVRSRPFVTAHNAWAYFADRYGLEVVAAVEPVPGREPSPAELRDLVKAARERRLGAVFTEPQFPAGAARVIAGDMGLALEVVDPLGGVPGRETYAEMMRFNARAFVRGLS